MQINKTATKKSEKSLQNFLREKRKYETKVKQVIPINKSNQATIYVIQLFYRF